VVKPIGLSLFSGLEHIALIAEDCMSKENTFWLTSTFLIKNSDRSLGPAWVEYQSALEKFRAWN
jgi:hypothetical protein